MEKNQGGIMENILVSACLLGVPCRYDGKSKPHSEVLALQSRYNLIPVCPEVSGGLPTPRIPCECCGERVLRRDGLDVTAQYQKGALLALEQAVANNCRIAILKERSPSCGNGRIYNGQFDGCLTEGDGVTAALLKQNGIHVIGESEIQSKLDFLISLKK